MRRNPVRISSYLICQSNILNKTNEFNLLIIKTNAFLYYRENETSIDAQIIYQLDEQDDWDEEDPDDDLDI